MDGCQENSVEESNQHGPNYNRNRIPQPLKVGDLVYYRNHPISHAGRQITTKLLHRWKGPLQGR